MYQITYTVGNETKKLLVDSFHYHQYSTLENLVKHNEPDTESKIEVIGDEYIGSVYTLPIVQPIGNIT